MKNIYIQKMDKHILKLRKIKIEYDNCEIYADLEKEKNIEKLKKKLIKNDVTNVVLSKELCNNRKLINALNANNIKIFDGRWLEKYLTNEILNYIITNKNIEKKEIEIAITVNQITEISIELIRNFAKQYKRVTIVTNHIEKLKRLEQEIYNKEGILIVLSNNYKKSLQKAQIILNMDFSGEILNRYKINDYAVILNLEGDIKIYSKRFNGIVINDYEICIGREELIWRQNMNHFKSKDILESAIYVKDSYRNICNKIKRYKITIKDIYGINGVIKL